MKTENLAIVFIDIAGFTPRTSAQTREENIRMLRRFDGAVRPLVRIYRGRVVKTIGDAYLLTFRSPTDALLCSMAVHDRLAESDRDVAPADRFTIRAAVNVGEVRIEDGDVFGEAVNIAARIEGKAGAGEIYFSESAFLSMTRSEVPSVEVGFTELKGIPGPVRLYRVPRADEAGGYALQPRDPGAGRAGGQRTTRLAPADLPYAGLGLDRVRARLGSAQVLEPVITQARGIAEKLPGALQRGADTTLRGVSWWRHEVRRSRTVQVITIGVIIALIALIVGGIKQRQRPATPWQKFQRSLGL